MTFTEIKTVVKDYLALTSTEADTRVGKAINRHYRRVTSLLGLNAARFVTRSQTTTQGVSTVTFTEIEKIDRIIDATTSTAIRLLTETSIHELRGTQPGTGQPSKWALQNTDADSVTVRLDVVPATGSSYSLQADGWTTLSDLSGSDEPVFPESFHDILAWFVISEELLKKEKAGLAKQYQDRAEQLLADLRFHLADSPMATTRQGGGSTSGASGGASGSAGNTGGTSYTQTGLLTFDRGSGNAPFAVASGSAKVSNLDADLLDGLSSAAFGLVASPLSQFAATTSAQLAGVLSDETGSGAAVFATSPTLVTPILGTPTSGTLTNCTGLPVSTGVSGLGTNVATALAVAVGSAGAPVVNGGVLGTPSSGTLTNCTGLPVGSVTGLGSGVATFLATPSSANLASVLTDETGTAGTVPFASASTWTPSVGGSATYTTQTGTYIRIGNLVVVNGTLTINSIGTGSTSAISGLPFAASARFSASISLLTTAAANFTWVGLYTTASASTLTFSIQDAADASTADAANMMGNGTSVIFTCVYVV